MIIEPTTCDLGGHTLLIRSGAKEDAATLAPYLKRLCGESRFLSREADECADLTPEQEADFILRYAEDEKKCLLLAFLDGEYVGNASFEAAGPSRRNAHRADIGIGLYADYTGMGIGSKLFARTLEAIRACGFEQAELQVAAGNERAIRLYRRFGFSECGRIPRANRYDDGTCEDAVFMYRSL